MDSDYMSIVMIRWKNTARNGLEKRLKTYFGKRRTNANSAGAVLVYKERTDSVRWEDMKEDNSMEDNSMEGMWQSLRNFTLDSMVKKEVKALKLKGR